MHNALEKEAGLGNVWSLESLRRWLHEAGDDKIETVQKFVNGQKPKKVVVVPGRLVNVVA